jgi:hypothetical protein
VHQLFVLPHEQLLIYLLLVYQLALPLRHQPSSSVPKANNEAIIGVIVEVTLPAEGLAEIIEESPGADDMVKDRLQRLVISL